MSEELSIKERRIRNIAISYYSRLDIRKNMLDFASNREVIPRYFEGFGKRPDTFQYESDIFELAKKGATSFHCSEEIWKDPLNLSTGMSEEQLNQERKGWDLLIDIDCKYLEYSKKAAIAIIKALEKNSVHNIGIKFSGGKGFHIIVPWKAFPDFMSGQEAKNMFPEWPRAIVNYLKEEARVFLEKELAKEETKFLKQLKKGVRCERCKNISQKKHTFSFICPACRTQIQMAEDVVSRKRKISCPNCSKEMIEKEKNTFYLCDICNISSKTHPNLFNEALIVEDVFAVLGLDVILVSSRHLFRMPYSLHEKTALASIVLDKDKIKDFDILDASPLKINHPKNFLPESKEAEATELLREALDFAPPESKKIEFQKTQKDKKYNEIILKDLTPDLYPPTIQKILNGMPSDGRKRALFILLNFFKSLKIEQEKYAKEIEEWNKKNYEPLRSGYIKAQLNWHSKTQAKLPPNFDKPYYKEIGLYPNQEEIKSKNPVNYVARRIFILKNKKISKNAKKSRK